jgi:hypothetical protein
MSRSQPVRHPEMTSPTSLAFDHNTRGNARRRIAIVHPASAVLAEMPTVRQVLDAGADDAMLVHLCFEGRHFDSSRATAADPAFLFTRLDPPVDLLLVLPQTQGVLPNTFTAAWLGTLLARGEAREIRIARDDEEHFRRLTNALRAALPATAFVEPDEHWLRLHSGAGLAERAAALPSSYGFLHGIDREFRGLWPFQGAETTLRNSLFGASRNSLILESLAERLGWGPRPRLLDIGGAYGCLGLELAAKDWDVTVADNDPTKTESLGPWLVRLSPQPLAIEFCTLSMEDIATGGIPGDGAGWDAITFFLSLYNAKRERVPALLRACWQRLAPGGALVIHEVVPLEARERVDDLQFERDELIRLVTENAAPPGYVSMTDASLSAEFGHWGAGALLGVKPRGGAMSPTTSRASR